MDDLVTKYKFGGCYGMAMALSREFGFRIGLLVVDLKPGPFGESGRHLVHAYAIDQSGRMFDAGGALTHDDIEKQYIVGYERRFTAFRHEQCDDDVSLLAILAEFAIETGRSDEFAKHRPHLLRQADQAADDIIKIETLADFITPRMPTL